ncbi:alpha/beta fold hydrolase [Rhodococcus sp. NPDC057529]|uniref:alpha/beta fold hydrolase n=1 Tax=Rhodococcus sp. NPDC057529 TaxID=3346158 RepID=UPI00366E6F33
MTMMDTTPAFTGRNWRYWTEPTILDIDGVPTAYRRGGAGETLVYLHGGGHTRAWTPLHRELAQHFDVIAPEHPGFGDSPRPAEMDNWEDWILHYDAFFRALDLDHFHLVGTSLGAWLAANLAIYYPERYRSLTLITPLGVRIPDEPLFDIFRLSPAEGLDRLLNGRATQHEDQLAQEDDFEDGIQAFREDSTAALLMWNPRYDLKLDHRLSRITAPTLVLAAEDDRTVGNEQARGFADRIPSATLTVLAGPGGEPSSHGMVIDQSAEVAATVAAHVAAAVAEPAAV